MKSLFLFLLLLFTFSNVEARDFFRTDFYISAHYEDLSGNNYKSETSTGKIRVSSDGKFCIADLPELSKDSIPCSVEDAYSGHFGIKVDNKTLVSLYELLVHKINAWPSPYLKRYDKLIWSFKKDLLLGNAMNFNTFQRFQLHDNTAADAVHISAHCGSQWVAY